MRVVYDANVLYSATLRDVLIRVGMARLVQPKWTEQILDETFENLLANRPDLDPARLERTRDLMNAALRDVLVTGYEPRIADLSLPDPDDRHVLAAAIHADAELIITKNLRDFPADTLMPLGIQAQHPDMFLCALHQDYPRALTTIVCEIATVWRNSKTTPIDVLDSLSAEAPRAAELIGTTIGL
ncbi:MAG: PIN domain-containing protein [Micrococcales bacterium]|nr:PIN domain-containing protein [Micrococcales bacterium]MCL2668733.1 PIN domain-containing protein [Micrococcales bacterium]